MIRLHIHMLYHFNPRSRMGATMDKDAHLPTGVYFNPRSRMGATVENIKSAQTKLQFQSTLPYGSDPKCQRIKRGG